MAAVQQAHVVDAAARPRDRRFFETENRPECLPDILGAAQLSGNPLGVCPPIRSRLTVYVCPARIHRHIFKRRFSLNATYTVAVRFSRSIRASSQSRGAYANDVITNCKQLPSLLQSREFIARVHDSI